ncbi:MAG: lysylphosphatidylglycerol synthase transmembrane domain-containing protein [Kiloniellales bacterium]|nr:lysylphosphatidylglycerol synthase transmembrane domain-containing protein [Kiloniellales bacterium]
MHKPFAAAKIRQRWAPRRLVLLGLMLGGVFLIFAFREASFQGIVDALQIARPQSILIGMALYSLYLVARASRWSLLLADRSATRDFSVLLRAVTWGTAANAVIPHSGEILRSLVTRKTLGISATSILGSIGGERLYDFMTITILTGMTLILFQDSSSIVHTALRAIFSIGIVLFVGLFLIAFKFTLIARLIDVITNVVPDKYRNIPLQQAQEISVGVRAALSNRRVARIAVLSVGQWLCAGGCIYLSMESLSLMLSPWVAFIVLALIVAGLTLPTAPAYLGTLQVCFLAGLAPFGVSVEEAIAASVVYTGVMMIPVIILSLFWWLELLLKSIRTTP